MKSLRINSECQKFLEAQESQTETPISAGVLIGVLENQTYQSLDVVPIDFSSFVGAKSFDEFLSQQNEQQETPLTRFMNLTSNVKMMLGGGLSIIGIVWKVRCEGFEYNSDGFKNLVDQVKDVGIKEPETIVLVKNQIKKKDESLLYDFNQRKFKTIEFQYQSIKERLFQIRTTIETELIISLPKSEVGPLKIMHISEKLKQSLRKWTADLSAGAVKVGSKFIEKTEALENIKTSLKLSENILDCEIFSQAPISKIFGSTEEETNTTITFKGAFTALAYVVSKKTPFKDAYSILLSDLLQSVQDKLNLFITEHEEILQQKLAQNKIFFLPNRAYFNFPTTTSGSLSYCDYILSGETLQDSEQRLKEWFSFSPNYVNKTEYLTAQAFQKSYIVQTQKEKTKIQQEEGVSKRKTQEADKKQGAASEVSKENPQVQSSDAQKNTTLQYGALAGVTILLFLLYIIFKSKLASSNE